MKWVVDTQLPYQLASALKKRGHEAVHVSELPRGNSTRDEEITALADRDGAVVVTKDGDFVAAKALSGKPGRLLYVTTGNIRNTELILLFMHCLDSLCESLEHEGMVELDRSGFTVR